MEETSSALVLYINLNVNFRCHEMSEQLHEDSKTRLREEMLSQFKDEKSEVVCKYEIQLSTLRSGSRHIAITIASQ